MQAAKNPLQITRATLLGSIILSLSANKKGDAVSTCNDMIVFSRNILNDQASIKNTCQVLMDDILLIKLERKNNKDEGHAQKFARVVARLPVVKCNTMFASRHVTFQELKEGGPGLQVAEKNEMFEELSICIALHQLCIQTAIRFGFQSEMTTILQSMRKNYQSYGTPESKFNYSYSAGIALLRCKRYVDAQAQFQRAERALLDLEMANKQNIVFQIRITLLRVTAWTKGFDEHLRNLMKEIDAMPVAYRVQLYIEVFKIYSSKNEFRKSLLWAYKAKSALADPSFSSEYKANKYESLNLMLLKLLLEFDGILRQSQGTISEKVSREYLEIKLAKNVILEKLMTNDLIRLIEKNSDSTVLVQEAKESTIRAENQFGTSSLGLTIEFAMYQRLNSQLLQHLHKLEDELSEVNVDARTTIEASAFFGCLNETDKLALLEMNSELF